MRLKIMLPAVMILAAVFAAGHEVHSQKARQKCGFISEVSGKPVLRRGSKYYLVSGMEGVYCGESIRVPAGARVVIAQCATNTRSEIAGPAEFTVTAKALVFKTGSAKVAGVLNADLCPFFMEKTFTNLQRPEVMANGEFRNGIGEMYGTAVGMGPGSRFNGYLTEVSGEVYLPEPPVYKVTGDLVPGEEQLLVSADGAVTIFSCDDGKKYRVQGPALVRLRQQDGKKRPVVFLRGQPEKVEEIDVDQCGRDMRVVKKNSWDNTQSVGLDGKTK